MKMFINKKKVVGESFCVDNLSSWGVKPYYEPELIRDFKRNADAFFKRSLKKLKVDMYNDGVFDNYIEAMVNKAKSELERQKSIHIRTIEDIRTGQMSRLAGYKERLEHLIQERDALMNSENSEGGAE